jgi:adenylate cyclase
MPAAPRIVICESDWVACWLDFCGPVELGRQSEGEEGPYYQTSLGDCTRVVIGRQDERGISRRQLRLELQGADRVLVKNLSAVQAVAFSDSSQVGPNASREMAIPLAIILGKRAIRVETADAPAPAAHRLHEATLAPGASAAGPGMFPALGTKVPLEDSKTLLGWLRSSMSVFQSAAGSRDFFDKAAQAVIDIVGLDSGRVLLLEGQEWELQAIRTAGEGQTASAAPPSRRILSLLREEQRTLWELSPELQGGSVLGMGAVVAAPILDCQGRVIGAVYGDRGHLGGPAAPPAISELEAMLVELIACGVAAGLARLEQEQAALAARVRFEQFFTPQLARQLAAHPDLLDGRDSEVSVLFCDIRGFTCFSEALGPARTVEWLRDVLETLSACVLEHAGVLVDYVGDQLMAMWGAPDEQPDHARLACLAALDMLGKLPLLNERWQPMLQARMGVGIGINSGIARVGNTGSRYKFKYGPLGNAVNVASRVEGATKYLRTRLLVTGATRAGLDESFAARRLCQVRVVNIAGPVDLYELAPPGDPRWPDLRERYEQALQAFEQREFRRAAQIAGNLLEEYPDDGPALLLLSRSVGSLVEGPAAAAPVWELPGK